MNRHFEKLCVIGCGLIGSSVALAFANTGRVKAIIGVDADEEVLRIAEGRHIIHTAAASLAQGVRGADLIVIATPVSKTMGVLEQIAALEETLAPDAIVTDVTGVKSRIAAYGEVAFTRATFIGGHPMAGSEKSGVRAADAKLLENAVYVLTPSHSRNPSAVAALVSLVKETGARVKEMTPEHHDRVVAAISHVPHLIAATLVNQVQARADADETYAELAAGGFRDITRIASSDPVLWRDICLANEQEIAPLIDDWMARLQHLRDAIRMGNVGILESFFTTARQFRDTLPAKSTGAIRAVYAFTLPVSDEPGIIGRVASLLGQENVSIRNIGILESREDDDGQLLLQFDTAAFHDRAIVVLTQHGYQIIDRL